MPTHAVKKGTRYRYVSTSLVTGAKSNGSNGRRIPAGNLEGLVTERLRSFFADPAAILDSIDSESHSGAEQGQLIERSRQFADELGGQAPEELKALLMALLRRVEIRSDRVDIALSRSRLTELLAGTLELQMQQLSRLAESIRRYVEVDDEGKPEAHRPRNAHSGRECR